MAEFVTPLGDQSDSEKVPEMNAKTELSDPQCADTDFFHPPVHPNSIHQDLTPGFNPSCMTTGELQQHWRAVKQKKRAVKLLFEFPSTRTIEQPTSRYVVYQIVVIRSGTYDQRRVAIERRYNDFLHLHQRLLQDFSEELEDVTLPRKKVRGNFSEEGIAERRVSLRDYLTQLYSLRCVRRSPVFVGFFTHPELKTAHDLLRGGQFSRALEVFQRVLVLQEKLSGHDPALMVPTQCAIVVCHRDLDDPLAAFQTGQQAIPTVRRYALRRYRCPLLEALVDLGYRLRQPVAQLQDELAKLSDSQRGLVSVVSLKELVVQEFT